MSGDDQTTDGLEPTQDQSQSLPKDKQRAPGPATRALGRPTILGLDGQTLVEGVNLKNESRAAISAKSPPASSVKVEEPISATARELLRKLNSSESRVDHCCWKVAPAISAAQAEAVKATAAEIYQHLRKPDFSDLEIVCNLLEARSAAELRYLSAAYAANHPGLTLEGDLKNARAVDGWSDGQNEKAISLLYEGHLSAGARDASFVHRKLEQLKKDRRDDNDCSVERELRRTVLQMSAEQIEEMERSYKQQGHGSLFVGLLTNHNISQETREALSIYLKGKNKCGLEDVLKMVDAAVRRKNLSMLHEALGRSPQTAHIVDAVKQRFLQAGGSQRLKEAFGRENRFRDQNGNEVVMYAESEELRAARQVCDPEAVNLSDRIRECVAGFQPGNDWVDVLLQEISKEQRSRYSAGKKLACGLTAEQRTAILQSLSNQQEGELSPDKLALKFYLEVDQALFEANAWCMQSQLERWQAMLESS